MRIRTRSNVWEGVWGLSNIARHASGERGAEAGGGAKDDMLTLHDGHVSIWSPAGRLRPPFLHLPPPPPSPPQRRGGDARGPRGKCLLKSRRSWVQYGLNGGKGEKRGGQEAGQKECLFLLLFIFIFIFFCFGVGNGGGTLKAW